MKNESKNETGESKDGAAPRGRLFILSAPSGAGKTTLCKAMRRRFPAMVYSVSFTTRTPREGEIEGIDYHFVSGKKFKEMIEAGAMAEWAEVHGHYYGTSAEWLEDHLEIGHDILLDIDVEGTRQIARKFPDSIKIFIMPPSMEELERRLRSRASNDIKDMKRRIANAEKEIASKDLYDHVIVNDRLEEAIEQLAELIERKKSVAT